MRVVLQEDAGKDHAVSQNQEGDQRCACACCHLRSRNPMQHDVDFRWRDGEHR